LSGNARQEFGGLRIRLRRIGAQEPLDERKTAPQMLTAGRICRWRIQGLRIAEGVRIVYNRGSMNAESTPSIDSWTAYWRTGRGASCFDGRESELHLTRLWDELIDSLSDNTRLLDLATGNGAVVRSLVVHARARAIRLEIDAVDAADIDPQRDVAHAGSWFAGVRFHGRTRLEALPFPDARFGAVVSQFGFEYADEEPAAAEAARVLAPGGRLRFIIHARDGAVARDIGLRLERLRGVLADDGPVALVLALARAAESGDVATLNRRSQDLPAAIVLARRLAAQAVPDDAALFYSREFLQLWERRARYWPAALRRSLEEGWINANGVATRQAELLRVAASAEDVARIGARLAAGGLRIDAIREIKDERRNVQAAWLLDASRPRTHDASA
jgi:SAM-dependent methyltransferase